MLKYIWNKYYSNIIDRWCTLPLFSRTWCWSFWCSGGSHSQGPSTGLSTTWSRTSTNSWNPVCGVMPVRRFFTHSVRAREVWLPCPVTTNSKTIATRTPSLSASSTAGPASLPVLLYSLYWVSWPMKRMYQFPKLQMEVSIRTNDTCTKSDKN